ncbi:hypothetical protein [Rhodococcus sp. (in: high G+C Gram-positive bacteria)]|uniref:hypothetical protein n=1 Tax=Rhodococcus sp. TaxID=1831 RepID=UPI003B8A8626
MATRIVAFDVVERSDVGVNEIHRLARDLWQAMSSGREGASDRPRWINSGAVADADAYTAHRFEGTVESEA